MNAGLSQPLATARAHWTIYLPTMVVAIVWALVYGWARLHEPPLKGLGALALAVEVLAVPLLLLFAAIRARVLSVEVRARGDGEGPADGLRELLLRQGFIHRHEMRVGANEIAFMRVRRSFPQRLFGGGALDMKMVSGDRLWIADLDTPDDIVNAIRIARPQPDKRGDPGEIRLR
ncbi:MAG: hypothetical protein WBG82_03630 [Parvibaculum sp.]|uniref:hypothetical protein n=1 Tax=Parvibaculum sp. TaxID=2024848 RepID=UPI003C78CDFA